VSRAEDFSWSITKHICRACMGRVLARETFDGKRLYRCSNCGVEREGGGTSAICCCGIRLGKSQRDAGIRCLENPRQSPECMSEIVASQVVLTTGKPAPKPGLTEESEE
jgi:hypothetical protein